MSPPSVTSCSTRSPCRTPRAPAASTGAQLIDQLPQGFRYVDDSVRINGARAAEPSVAKQRHDADVCAARGRRWRDAVESDYVTAISVGAQLGKAVNAAHVTGTGVGVRTPRRQR